MSELVIDGIEKRFGAVTALKHVSLTIPSGAFTCLLGPSGCGKTTLLRIVAGLETPNSGAIRLDGQDITGRPAHQRELGMVFQSLALFPHLSVAENIAYGLKIRGVPAARRRARAEELLELIRLPGVGDRQITQLSGGQRQRVAIARALALEPKIFLLDEPLSALDAKLREEMQIELRQLQQRLGVTTILVTHDQREAMTMADLIVVMDHGEAKQVGAPLDVYRAPTTRFVAEFLGGANLFDGRLSGPAKLAIGAERHIAEIAVGQMNGVANGATLGAPATLCIRAEDVRIEPADHGGENRLPARIAFLRDLGHQLEVTVDAPQGRFTALLPSNARGGIAVGDAATLHLPAEACRALDQ